VCPAELAEEPAVRLVGRDGVVEGSRSWRIRYAALADPTHSPPPLPDEQALAWEVWQMSHFGWITEGMIRRNLSVTARREFPAAAVAAGLQRLLERGWIEHQEAGADTGEREWRLTDTGRDALPPAVPALGVLP
jgi:hypothetical protein